MEADVVKGTQRIAVAENHDGVWSDVGGDELPVLPELLHPANELPRVREDALALQFE